MTGNTSSMRGKYYTILFSVITVLILSTGEISAGVIKSEFICEAIIDTLTAVAEREGLEIEASVHNITNVVINGREYSDVTIEVKPVKVFRSRMSLKVEFFDRDGNVLKRVYATARVKSYATVAVTSIDLNRWDIINSEDVVMKKMDVTGYNNYFVSYFDIEDMQAKRRIKAGGILTRKNVELIPIITRGDRIIMKVSVGNAVITAQGIARENGGLNEYIRIYSELSRKTIICRIIDSKTVEVGEKGG